MACAPSPPVSYHTCRGNLTMQFTFSSMDAETARTICSWRYEGQYAVYDIGGANEKDVTAEMLDRRSPYYAVRDEHGEVVGFFNFGSSAQVWDSAEPGIYAESRTVTIGLGLRPDLTGQGRGIGLAFVNAGLAFAREQFAPKHLRMYVMTFNTRAIRVYEEVGFRHMRVFTQHNIHGELEFLEMSREA